MALRCPGASKDSAIQPRKKGEEHQNLTTNLFLPLLGLVEDWRTRYEEGTKETAGNEQTSRKLKIPSIHALGWTQVTK